MAAKLFRLTAPSLSEADVTRQIIGFLEVRGWFAQRCHVGTFVPYRVLRESEAAVNYEARSRTQRMQSSDQRARERKQVISMGEKGQSDWLVAHPVLPSMFIEMKAPGEKPREDQLKFMHYMHTLRKFKGGWFDSLDSFIRYYFREIEPPVSGAVARTAAA